MRHRSSDASGERRGIGRIARALVALALGGLSSGAWGQARLTERALADIATIAIPSNLENALRPAPLGAPTRELAVDRDALKERLAFAFQSAYVFASMGSTTAWRQRLFVTVMAPDATDAEYAEAPRRMSIGYDERRVLPPRTLGSGTLAIEEGVYRVGGLNEPAVQFHYADRARRLQIVWHAVKKEVDADAGAAQIARIAASFRIVRDPVDWFAAMRAAPAEAVAQRTSRVARARAMLAREGFPALEPGKPALRDGVYVEWMADPEPRYQLLVPLGRSRAAAPGDFVQRPRPVRGTGGPLPGTRAGTIGWREHADGDWVFSNQSNAYLPLAGIGAALAARQRDPAFVYFYYVATVRVEEESDERLLDTLAWFLDGVPEMQRRWRAGALLATGRPEPE
jgi:hypothetical protein